MSPDERVPLKIIILDDHRGKSSWGYLTSKQLERAGYESVHVTTWNDAVQAIESSYFDVFIVDLDLNEPRNGRDFLRYLRENDYAQPVILATGNEAYLEQSIEEYAESLASGAVQFYSKMSGMDLEAVLDQASTMVDPVRRSLALMQTAGMGDRKIRVNGEEYTVDELLALDPNTSSLIRKLREALRTVMLEIRRGETE